MSFRNFLPAILFMMTLTLSAQTVQTRVEPDSGYIGDPVTLTISIHVPDTVHLDPPRLEETLGNFTLLSQKTETSFEDDFYTRTFIFEMTVFDTGEQIIPALNFRIRGVNGKKEDNGFLTSDSLSVNIESVLGKLKDMPEVHEPLPVSVLTLRQKIAIAILALLVLGLLYLMIRYKYKSSRQTDDEKREESPYEAALRELDHMLAEAWHEKGEGKRFYLRLTAILKNYIERTFYLHLSDLSTSELIPVLEIELPSLWTEEMSRMLRFGDLVKFARQSADKETCLEHWNLVQQWCENAEDTAASRLFPGGNQKLT